MNRRIELGRISMRSALELRRSRSISRDDPVNVYDLAKSIGLEVNFVDAPSLEGMFARIPNPVVLLPSLKHRPHGRVTHSCAHELGHFQLGHGTHVAEYVEDDSSRDFTEEEFAANCFASNLIMPRQCVTSRFRLRSLDPNRASSVDLFTIANELDIGYGTLLKHMAFHLEIVNAAWLKAHLKVTPKVIKEAILADDSVKHLVVVSQHWPNVPIDLEVGDVISVPIDLGTQEHKNLVEISCSSSWRSFKANFVGQANISIGGGVRYVRIARKDFCGRLKFRHLEEADDV